MQVLFNCSTFLMLLLSTSDKWQFVHYLLYGAFWIVSRENCHIMATESDGYTLRIVKFIPASDILQENWHVFRGVGVLKRFLDYQSSFFEVQESSIHFYQHPSLIGQLVQGHRQTSKSQISPDSKHGMEEQMNSDFHHISGRFNGDGHRTDGD